MANVKRLIELGMPTELAKEVQSRDPADLVANIATVATPDATDEATAVTLANALKARLNALITALKA